MKDKTLLFIPLIGIFFILTGIVIYDNYATNKANEKLKKEIDFKISERINSNV